ncbi:DUF4064 domain-containing protein [Bacillus sp. FSL W7-1360]
MNRTVEKVLGIIGVSLYFVGGLAAWMLHLILMEEENAHIFSSNDYFWVMIGAFIASISGVFAVVVIRKLPKTAGAIFISSVIVYIVMTNAYLIFLIPLAPAVLYIIAGIMVLMRAERGADVQGGSHFCVHCGSPITNVGKFCSSCGKERNQVMM